MKTSVTTTYFRKIFKKWDKCLRLQLCITNVRNIYSTYMKLRARAHRLVTAWHNFNENIYSTYMKLRARAHRLVTAWHNFNENIRNYYIFLGRSSRNETSVSDYSFRIYNKDVWINFKNLKFRAPSHDLVMAWHSYM